jgi:hypothetical protein
LPHFLLLNKIAERLNAPLHCKSTSLGGVRKISAAIGRKPLALVYARIPAIARNRRIKK